MPHKLRKTRKMRGSRTHGYGRVGQHRRSSAKNRRKVGRQKHLWSYVLRYEPDYFGKKGFVSPKSLKREEKVINVGELEEVAEKLAAQQKPTKERKKITLDLEKLGYTKLLGTGEVTKPLLVKVGAYSKIAAKKIEAAGGQILQPKIEDKIN